MKVRKLYQPTSPDFLNSELIQQISGPQICYNSPGTEMISSINLSDTENSYPKTTQAQS